MKTQKILKSALVIVLFIVLDKSFTQSQVAQDPIKTHDVSKQFFLVYDHTCDKYNPPRLQVLLDTLYSRNPVEPSKKIKNTQKKFMIAYKRYIKNEMIISSDSIVQSTFDENMKILNDLLSKNILSYTRSSDGRMYGNQICSYLSSYAFLLQKGRDKVMDSNNKKEKMSERNFLITLYGIYNNLDVVLYDYFQG